MARTNPIRPTDDDARRLARGLIDTATFAALGVSLPDTAAPFVTRIAMGTDPDGAPVSLVSDLATHTAALRASPACSLLLGEPGDRGDPLTHPRLTLTCRAAFVARDDPGHGPLRAHYLARHPKAKLYADFADFHFLRFTVAEGFLNAGFGQAFRLTPADLGL